MTTTYLLLRLALGLNLLLHGVIRIWHGREAFAAALCKEFAGTPLPSRWVEGFGLYLPLAETLIGLLLLLGLLTPYALLSGMAVMLMLMIGKSLKQDWQTVSLQMIYIGYYAALAGLLKHNRIALDHFFLTSK